MAKILATYDYTDEGGRLLYENVRFEPKDFRQRRSDGNGGWVWNLNGVRRVLYRLPELLESPKQDWALFTEGEKDVESLRALGFTATTSGSASSWRPEFVEYCRCRLVAIVPDADAPGAKFAQTVATALHGVAAEVRIVALPDGVKDISDWIEQRDALDAQELRAAIVAMIDAAPPFRVPTPERDREPGTDVQGISRSIGKEVPGRIACLRKQEHLYLEPATPFPVDALPAPVDHFVDGVARAIGCDPSYVALPLLAGLASAIGNTRRIRLKPGWNEPAIVWGAIVGESGTLKSPAMETALRPIYQRQHAAMKRYAEAIEAYEVLRMQYEKELVTWKRPKADGEPPVKPEEPVAVRCWCDDTTIEALAVLLLQNPRGLLLKRDELAGWLGSFDRYSQNKRADAAKWLEMFGGRSIMVDRKTGQAKTIYVQRAAVSVAGGIQPETLRRALGVEHRENGLAARLLLACPSRQTKRWTEDDVSQGIESQMEALFDKLYSLELVTDANGDARPLDLPLTTEGKNVWVHFYNDHAKEQEELTGDLAAAWSKLEGYAARLGLIVHLVRWAAGDPNLATVDEIDPESVEAGVRLSRWFGNEARRVYEILGESEGERDRRRLIELIQRKGGSVTVRDLMRSARMFSDADVAEQALNELVKAGHGHWEAPPIGPAGGHPTRRFVLDPGVDADETSNSSMVSGVVSASTVPTGTDCSDERDERAAILEYDGSLPHEVAEERAFRTDPRA